MVAKGMIGWRGQPEGGGDGTDLLGPTLTLTRRSSLEIDETGVVCFATGTMVLTANGEVAIEDLRAGGMIQTMDCGLQPLAMLARRRLGAVQLSRCPKLKPVLVQDRVREEEVAGFRTGSQDVATDEGTTRMAKRKRDSAKFQPFAMVTKRHFRAVNQQGQRFSEWG